VGSRAILVPSSLNEEGHECVATVVYVNNGRSLADIRLQR